MDQFSIDNEVQNWFRSGTLYDWSGKRTLLSQPIRYKRTFPSNLTKSFNQPQLVTINVVSHVFLLKAVYSIRVFIDSS